MAIDWTEKHRVEVAQREERRARKSGGNGRTVAATTSDTATVVSRTKIRKELRRLAMAESPERISGANKLRRSLRGQPGLERLLRAAERLTAIEPPSRLFG